MDDHQELIERLRYERANDPEKMMRTIAANVIESLLAENDRLKHNLTSTEQTMREYQELAAKRLEEIAKYRDAPVVAYRHLMEDGWEYFDAPTGDDCPKCVPLIVKPGEAK